MALKGHQRELAQAKASENPTVAAHVHLRTSKHRVKESSSTADTPSVIMGTASARFTVFFLDVLGEPRNASYLGVCNKFSNWRSTSALTEQNSCCQRIAKADSIVWATYRFRTTSLVTDWGAC